MIDNANKAEMFETFQSWLQAWQQDCSNKGVYEGNHVGNGIGSSLMGASNWFEFALEQNKIFRPSYDWIWATANQENCTFQGLATLDCYFKPLSRCGKFKDTKLVNPSAPSNILLSSADLARHLLFAPIGVDSCELAARAKKSLQWVHGNILHYLVRPNEQLQIEVQTRAKDVFDFTRKLKDDNKSGGIIIGVHIRGKDSYEFFMCKRQTKTNYVYDIQLKLVISFTYMLYMHVFRWITR